MRFSFLIKLKKCLNGIFRLIGSIPVIFKTHRDFQMNIHIVLLMFFNPLQKFILSYKRLVYKISYGYRKNAYENCLFRYRRYMKTLPVGFLLFFWMNLRFMLFP